MAYLTGFGVLWSCSFCFLLSLDESGEVDQRSGGLRGVLERNLSIIHHSQKINNTTIQLRPLQLAQSLDVSHSSNSFIDSEDSDLPEWMTSYFRWHANQISSLNETNWNNDRKYLVMRCLVVDNKCGGAADRLKMIPAALRLAHKLKRIFLIKWERPHALEEFLVPPKDGLNWSIPSWLDENFKYGFRPDIITDNHFKYVESDNHTLITMRYQSNNHGSIYYNENKAESDPDFNQVYRKCWSKVFEPSPPVAALIEKNTKEFGLAPGNYVSVHVRSKYQSDRAEDSTLIQNAVNCGSQLHPGIPIYIAADDNRVTEMGIEYGASKGGIVVAHQDEQSPLHLDRGSEFFSKNNILFVFNQTNWSDFPPVSYYDIFVDLYMIAQSRCVTVNKGGFGRWGQLLMENNTCYLNHGKNHCEWAAVALSQ
jgi:hypothetical protein